MNIFILKKFKTIFIIEAIISVICVFLILSILWMMILNVKLNKKIIGFEQYVQKQEENLTEFPYQLINGREREKEIILKEYLALKQDFNTQMIAVPMNQTPLSFKQKLFNVQEFLQKKAQSKNILLPELVGFSEYKVSLPLQKQTVLFFRELLMVKEIMEEILSESVFAVNEIKLAHESTLTHSDTTGQHTAIKFETIPAVFKIETDFKNLRKILSSITEKNNIYVLKKISIKSKDEHSGRILADLYIENVKVQANNEQ